MENKDNLNNNIPSNEEPIKKSKIKRIFSKILNGIKVSIKWIKNNILKPLKIYLKNIGYDIKRSISENPNIIWFFLIGLPGIFIGLFLTQHINASKCLNEDFAWSGLEIFIMELAGCLDIVWGFGVMKKKNWKSIICALITTVVIVVCGSLWISNFFRMDGVFSSTNNYKNDAILSIVTVSISMIVPTIGSIASIFTRDKNYKKETL